MPKRVSKSDSQMLHFKFLNTGAMSSGLATIPVAPVNALSPRAAIEADSWALYRLKQLRFRLRRVGTITSLHVAAFIAGVTDASPTASALSECIPRTILYATDSVPSDWTRVPAADLVGYQPWYKTVAGSPSTDVEVLGNIFIAGTTTESYAIEIEGVLEFRDGVPAGATPMPLMRQVQVQAKREKFIAAERARLLGLLSASAATSAPTGNQTPPSPTVQLSNWSLGMAMAP